MKPSKVPCFFPAATQNIKNIIFTDLQFRTVYGIKYQSSINHDMIFFGGISFTPSPKLRYPTLGCSCAARPRSCRAPCSHRRAFPPKIQIRIIHCRHLRHVKQTVRYHAFAYHARPRAMLARATGPAIGTDRTPTPLVNRPTAGPIKVVRDRCACAI